MYRGIDYNFSWAVSSYFFSSLLIEGTRPLIFVGWSLEYEMIFYLLFGFSIFRISHYSGKIFIIVLLLTLSLFTNEWLYIEFIFGVIIAIIYQNFYISKKIGLLILLLGITFLLISLLNEYKFYQNTTHNIRLLYWGLPSFMIVLGSVYIKPIYNKFFMYLGNASYSIYLIQVFTVSAFYKLIIILGFFDNINYDVLAIACIIFTLVNASIFHSIIEKPITNYFKDKRKN